MKKIITIFLLIGLLFSFHPVIAREVNQEKSKLEKREKRQLNHKKRHKSEMQGQDSSTAAQSEEKIKKDKDLRKKEIEIKEHSVDKNKKVKRVSTDENLPETVRNRNIP